MQELVTDDVTGKRFCPDDSRHQRSQIPDLPSWPDKRAAMRAAARNQYLRRYTVKANYQNLVRIYEHAINHSGSDSGSAAETGEGARGRLASGPQSAGIGILHI